MMKIKLVILGFCVFALAVSCNQHKENEVNEGFKIDVSLSESELAGGILTPEILWKFGRVGDVQVSENGENVIYTLTYYSVELNKGFTHIYTIPVSSGEPKALTKGEYNCFNPRWVQNNKKIAFISTEEGTPQIFVMNTDGSEKQKISDIESGINSFEFSPDGKRLLFCSDVKVDKTPAEIYPDLPEVNVIIAEDLMYRHWNSWHDYAYSHIFVADYDNTGLANVIDIMEGEAYDAPLSPYFDNSEITWSPDGKFVAYTCKKMSRFEYALSTDSDIYLFNTENGETKNITEGMLGYDKYPVFSNNMEYIAWESMETPGYESDKNRLMIMNLNTGEKEYLTRNFDQNVSNLVWSKDDNYIYFISGYHARHQIYKINTDNRSITQITSGNHDYYYFKTFGNDEIIANKMSMKQASEIFIVNNEGAEKQLTYVNKHIYDNIKMSEFQEKWVTTTDGKQMLVWLILPPNFDSTAQYPAILYCQGGPQSAVSQFWSYRWNFQIMASNGYVVIAPNRRGLPSFGQEWNAQISGDYGGQNMKDYLTAVDEMKKLDFIDGNRIGAVGASYGGFSVFWLAGHHEGRFKAFISHCGMFNLESQYAATEEMFFVNHDLGGAYWEKDNAVAMNSYANSPHRFVDKWDTPILIISGGYDFRIPYTESLQAFNAARLNGVESKLLIFPEETHFVLKPQNSILWQREFKAWLDKYL
jgi:dipeptidyl aminopeptidase/acylaminoacyl peptidase